MTCATRRLLLAASLLLAACPAGGDDEPDARVIDAADGGGGGASLGFEFPTAPVLPATVGVVEVDELRVWLRDVRATGDSAPGDDRTTRADLELEWREGRMPSPLVFGSAPPGVYARLDARLGRSSGDDHTWELRGRVHRSDGVFELELEGGATAAISVSLDALTLGATPRVATIELSLAFLATIDWESLPTDGDHIDLDDDHPALDAMTAALAAGFHLAGVR
jgi:hypothetical protein